MYLVSYDEKKFHKCFVQKLLVLAYSNNIQIHDCWLFCAKYL